MFPLPLISPHQLDSVSHAAAERTARIGIETVSDLLPDSVKIIIVRLHLFTRLKLPTLGITLNGHAHLQRQSLVSPTPVFRGNFRYVEWVTVQALGSAQRVDKAIEGGSWEKCILGLSHVRLEN